MNNARFLELLNLYLDHEISPAEARELESEVAHHPEHRRTYNQYCRMQRGCTLLAAHERATAPEARQFVKSLQAAELKIASPRQETFWPRLPMGLLSATALAACAVVVFTQMQSTRPLVLASNLSQEALVLNSAAPDRVVVNLPTAPLARGEWVATLPPKLGLASVGFIGVRSEREAEIATQDAAALEWMNRVEQLTSNQVVVDEHTFDPQAPLEPDTRVVRSRHSLAGNAEFTSFLIRH